MACMQPRDRAQAAQTVFLLAVVASLVTTVVALIDPRVGGGEAATLGVVIPINAVTVAAAFALTRSRAEAPRAWAAVPFLAVAVIAVLDLATGDASLPAQVFLCFPVIFAAFNLPRRGAMLITAATALADVLIAYSLLPVRAATVDVSYVDAALLTIAGVLVYSSERAAALLELVRQQAAVDPLTGLATRRVLDQTANSVLSGAASDTGTALVLLDVDHFKAVNDRLGHLAGDEVLVALAALLRKHVRSDSVISRMGGDEIAILLPGCDRNSAVRRADHLCAAVRAHAFHVTDQQEPVRLTASVGVAHAPTQADDLRSLYAAADAALYTAKRAGRDRVGVLPVVQIPNARRRSA